MLGMWWSVSLLCVCIMLGVSTQTQSDEHLGVILVSYVKILPGA